MLMLIAGLIGALGFVCVLTRKTLLGLLIGLQLMIMGASMMFVLAGIVIEGGSAQLSQADGHVGGILITLGGVAQLVAGYVLAIRLFYLKNRADISDLKTLKH